MNSSTTNLDILHYRATIVDRNVDREIYIKDVKKEVGKQLSETEVSDNVSIDVTGIFLPFNTCDSVVGRAFAEPPAESQDWRAA
ncbi:hypothetical protein [Salinigranum salinum]|uniref:hypothetical protein n=1 Tax=Salinigranum salinum TaxID=1364937 RepID=UPI001260E579|nr:hypothetical protein [Salinigranum salinum]